MRADEVEGVTGSEQVGEGPAAGEQVAPGLRIGPKLRPAWDRLLEVLSDGRHHAQVELVDEMRLAAPDLAQGTPQSVLSRAVSGGLLRKTGQGERCRFQLAGAESQVDDDREPPLEPNGRCKWCDTPVRWVYHWSRSEQAKPLHLEPVPAEQAGRSGHVLLVDEDRFTYVGERALRAGRGPIYVSHMEHCPRRPQPRKGHADGRCRCCGRDDRVAVDLPDPAYGPGWDPVLLGLCKRCRSDYAREAQLAERDLYAGLEAAWDRGIKIGFTIVTNLVELMADAGATAEQVRLELLELLGQVGMEPLPLSDPARPEPAPEEGSGAAEHG